MNIYICITKMIANHILIAFAIFGLSLGEEVKKAICRDGELFPHDSDCGKFVRCVHGELVTFSCPEPLHWYKNMRCEWPQPGGCDLSPPFTTPPDSNGPPAPCNPSNIPPECEYHIEHWPSYPVAHENDCTKFYICDRQVRYLQNCPAGLHFNRKFGTCDWPSTANCQCEENTS